ncbi:MAG: sulfatase [Myxococcota bacterium]
MRKRPLAALALIGASLLLAAAGPAPRPKPNVLVVVVDTLRADALGTYGQKRPTSPNIDALAKQSVVWENAWTQYTWTLPSYVSYMTSTWARSHGWDYQMGVLDKYKALDTRFPTLAEVFSSGGYATSAYFANIHIREDLGFGRGFQTFRPGTEPQTVKSAIADIQRWKDDGKPNFTYVHLMAPHVALIPTAESQAAVGTSLTFDPAKGLGYDHWVQAPADVKEARLREFVDAYHACVRDGDRLVGQVLAAADAAGAGDTVVALFSDHGEMLGEHGQIGHGPLVWNEIARVPLMIRAPGQKPRREAARTGRLIDVAPTLAELAGLPVPEAWQGLSLFAEGRPLVLTERDHVLAVTAAGYKTVEDRTKERFIYGFDLKADPLENAPSKDRAIPGIAVLVAAANQWRAENPKQVNGGEVLQLDEAERKETIEQLEALGYTQ